MKNLITKVIVALCIMLGSSFGWSMQKAQELAAKVSGYWSSFLEPVPEQATKELLALLEVWPYVDRPQPENMRFTKENISNLIAKGANINVRNAKGMSPLLKAINNKDVEIVRLLLNAGSKIDEKTAPVALAALVGSAEIINELIKFGADVNQKDENGFTALFWAARLNNPNTAQALLKAGADINAQSPKGDTPLMAAIINNNPDLVRLFLAEDTDLSIQDVDGETALDKAVRKKYPEIIKLLETIPSQLKKKME